MSDRINLADLRERELAWSRKMLTREEFDAFMDAVKAAHALAMVDSVEDDAGLYRAQQNLGVALARFGFGEDA